MARQAGFKHIAAVILRKTLNLANISVSTDVKIPLCCTNTISTGAQRRASFRLHSKKSRNLTMNTFTSRYAGGLIALVLLSACATQESGTADAAAGGSGAASGSLVANGKLTTEGEARRERAFKAYQAGNKALAYSEWLGIAEQGFAESQFNLSVMESDGDAGAPNAAKALAWLQKAADGNYPEAQFQLAQRYNKGDGVGKDVPKALLYWRKCAALGEKRCSFNAAVALAGGVGVAQDEAAARTLFAEAGSGAGALVAAQSELGKMYLQDNKERDYAKARQWLEQAAAGNDPEAQYNLALIYSNGYGVKADKRKALALYQRAAKQGAPAALNNLGGMYRFGEGVPKDQKKAVAMFKQAHDGGNMQATVNLADMTFKGWGVRANKTAAAELYKVAADAGHPAGRCRYAQALRHGDGVTRNPGQANRLQEAANNASIPCDSDAPLGAYLVNRRVKGGN
jgi:hypothetical protein